MRCRFLSLLRTPLPYLLLFVFFFTVSPGVYIAQTRRDGIPECGNATSEWTNLPLRIHAFFLFPTFHSITWGPHHPDPPCWHPRVRHCDLGMDKPPRTCTLFFSFRFFTISPGVHIAQTLHDDIAASEVRAPERKVVVQSRVRGGRWPEQKQMRGQKKLVNRKCAKIKTGKNKRRNHRAPIKRENKQQQRKTKRHKAGRLVLYFHKEARLVLYYNTPRTVLGWVPYL